MRILIPSHSFYPAQEGGPSNTLYWMASGLAKEHYDVKVVTTTRYITKGDVPENEWTRLNSFDVIYCSESFYRSTLEQSLATTDVIIANGVCVLSNFLFIIKALRKGKKVILSPRGELLQAAVFHKGRVYGVLKSLFFHFMGLVYGKRVVYHVTSEEEALSVRHYFGKESRIVDVSNYMILPERVERGDSSDDYLLYVGRLKRIKNIHLLLNALSMSKAFQESKYVLKIAGEKKGEYYDYLKNRVEELGLNNRVVFLGMVTGPAKDKLYAGARALFLVSQSENFGNVVIESLAQGTPVIASKGTPWECLQNMGAGYWIDATDSSIKESVDRIISMDDTYYQEMRKNAFALSRSYDIYSNIDKWEKVINNL